MKIPLPPTVTYGQTRAIALTEPETLIVLAALRFYVRSPIPDDEAAAVRGVTAYFNGLFPGGER